MRYDDIYRMDEIKSLSFHIMLYRLFRGVASYIVYGRGSQTCPGGPLALHILAASENWKMLPSEDTFQGRKASRHVRIQS